MAVVQEPLRASFWSRVLASLVDYLLILGWMLVLALATGLLWLSTGRLYNWLELGTAGAQLLGFMVLVLPVGIYLYSTETSTAQATVGKRCLGLRVVDAQSAGRVPKQKILLRTVIKLLPWEIAHFAVWNFVNIASTGSTDFPLWLLLTAVIADILPLIYLLTMAIHPQGRGPHDLVAGTTVIRFRVTPTPPHQENR
ncbi:RDD family protein [Glutamicibacter sp. NPDC087344]|uniref:RDD family protein n=1 Tax=Glutamicibacter sp. NPDC087344 TaxID=3363994 RepID=UPI0037FBA184